MAERSGNSVKRGKLRDWVGNISQVAGAKRYVLDEGPARGVGGVDFWTGSGLTFTVLPDRGMDIPYASWKGRSLCWHSPAGILTAERFEPEGMGWLRTFFGGLLTTCGPRHFGAPAEDEAEGVSYGLHGRLNVLSATDVAVRRQWQGDDYVLSVSGRLTDACVFKPTLTLQRTISTRLGSNSFEIHDVATNAGSVPTPFMILYHINIGYPLLSADSRLVIKTDSVEPRDEEAAKGAEKWAEFEEPKAAYKEKCYLMEPAADADGKCTATIVNPKLDDGLGLSVTWDKAALGYMTEWKMMGQPEYVLGIEPCNTPILPRDELRRRNLLPVLEPGASREIRLTLKVHEGIKAINALSEGLCEKA